MEKVGRRQEGVWKEWAQRYERALSDIFELQDEITETIVGAILPELSRAERERAKSKKPEILQTNSEKHV